MSEEQPIQFSAAVGKFLESEGNDAQELWTPIAQEFDRAGPDAAREYLEAQRQQHEERVENLLQEVDGR